jgi:hypothetical protein
VSSCMDGVGKSFEGTGRFGLIAGAFQVCADRW